MAGSGPASVAARLMPLIYAELRTLATSCMSAERADHTLSATALVNEALLRILEAEDLRVADRTHLFAIAATELRRILVDHARRRRSLKRGGTRTRVRMCESIRPSAEPAVEVLVIDEALDRLAREYGRPSRVAELRFFGGLSLEETAPWLGVSRKTVVEDWRFARAWLSRELA